MTQHRYARLVKVGTANPENFYTQEEVLAWSGEKNPKIRNLFLNSHIEKRALYLPELINGLPPEETPQTLSDRHLNGALDIGSKAINNALKAAKLNVEDIQLIVCTTSTGFLCPSLTAHLIKHIGLNANIRRMDLVGMGCNAAVNGLQAATAIAQSLTGRNGLLVSIEICSAAYVINQDLSTAVVNSLFGDGASAMVIRSDAQDDWRIGPAVIDFEPLIITEAIGAMRYNLDGARLSFFLDREIPHVIGRNAPIPIGRLLDRHGLKIPDVKHWILHSGGKKVIDSIVTNLALPEESVRHTRNILKRYGNVSSSAVIFALGELLDEGIAKEGDYGVLMAMGPGSSIETTLLQW
jgi:alkylresorcinol/alkylpyrone synthase/polyketide synthase Type III